MELTHNPSFIKLKMKHLSKKFSEFDLELTRCAKYGVMFNMEICCYNTLSLTCKNCNFLELLKNGSRLDFKKRRYD